MQLRCMIYYLSGVEVPAQPKSLQASRRHALKFFEPESLTRIANTLERLVALYERDLIDRGVVIDLPATPEGEGEILVTDDDDVAALIARIRSNQPTGVGESGFYVGGDDSAFRTPAPQAGQTTEVGSTGWLDQTLFGSGWGINVGPEGAEESGASPDRNGSTGVPASSYVRRQGNSPEPQG